jgi:hypothetical protein
MFKLVQDGSGKFVDVFLGLLWILQGGYQGRKQRYNIAVGNQMDGLVQNLAVMMDDFSLSFPKELFSLTVGTISGR